ncbi:RagB/SusD family nutrient uptake outer membrane protein [Chitinophagaceae bacterium 26-R-25]|nr:RagB/SusD family nutrient uptake outer membrane protein [Chitinophagaceae bacterium 26-R-25]
MKRILIYSSILFASVAGVGCKKMLDQPVQGAYEADKFFNSDVNANLAVNDAYPALLFTDGGSNAIWVLGDVASDDAVKGGLPGDQADFDNVDNFNILPSNSAVEAVWRRYYDGIFKCNVALSGVPDDNTMVSDAVKKSVTGQAKFLRAYYYFLLTSCYGNIPLHLKVETVQETQQPAAPQADVYAQIEADLTDASGKLPLAWDAANNGRPTKGAALALLAKVYLFEQKWQQASSTAQAVRDLNIYSLTNLFTDNFNQNKKLNTEAVFSVWHQTASSQSFLGNNLNQWFAPRGSLNGYGFFNPTQSLVDNFEKTTGGVVDPRLDYTIARFGHPYYDVDYDSSWSTTGYMSKKQIQPLSEIPATIKGDGNLNYEAIRFSDVLLIQAEALNEQGLGAQALAPLNMVRKRARESYLYDNTLPDFGTVPDGLLPDVVVTDQGQLRDIIRKERRSELALEFHRYFDVIRYGSAYANSALSDKPAFNYDQDKFFPIPQSERDTNKKL